LGYLKISILDMLFFPDLMEKEEVKEKPAYIEIAFNAGRELSEALS